LLLQFELFQELFEDFQLLFDFLLLDDQLLLLFFELELELFFFFYFTNSSTSLKIGGSSLTSSFTILNASGSSAFTVSEF